MQNERQEQVFRWLIAAAALVVIVWGLNAAKPLVVTLLVSAFLAVIGTPGVMWLYRRRIPLFIAVCGVVLGMLTVGLAIAALVGTSVTGFTEQVPVYQARLAQKFNAVQHWLGGMGVAVSKNYILEQIDPGAAMQLVTRVLSGLSTALTNIVLIFLIVVFVLMEAPTFPRKMRQALRRPDADFTAFHHFSENLQRYLVIKTVVSLVTGVVIAVWLTLLGVDFPLMWGMLAFLLNYVPNIGSIIAAVPAVLIAFIDQGLGLAVLAASGYVGVNFVLGNIVEPRLMGHGLGLSALVVFLSLLLWGSILGPVGMILSVPITMTLKLALESHPSTEWIAVLLGADAKPGASSAKSSPS